MIHMKLQKIRKGKYASWNFESGGYLRIYRKSQMISWKKVNVFPGPPPTNGGVTFYMTPRPEMGRGNRFGIFY